MRDTQRITLEKDFFNIDITVINAETIARIEVHPNVITPNYKLSSKNGFFAGSCIHNPTRMATNIKKHFIEKLSIQEYEKAYENNNARFAIIAIYDHKITLFFKENKSKQNKLAYDLLLNQSKHNVTDLWVVFVEKT